MSRGIREDTWDLYIPFSRGFYVFEAGTLDYVILYLSASRADSTLQDGGVLTGRCVVTKRVNSCQIRKV
jgi:hypothetical protein